MGRWLKNARHGPESGRRRGQSVLRIFETNLIRIYGKILLQRTALSESRRKAQETKERNGLGAGEKPLTCIFTSRMKKYVQDNGANQRYALKKQDQAAPIHRLNSLLSKAKMHASYSPLMTSFETIPVTTPEAETNWRKPPAVPREFMHGTLLLMQFRSKKAREE